MKNAKEKFPKIFQQCFFEGGGRGGTQKEGHVIFNLQVGFNQSFLSQDETGWDKGLATIFPANTLQQNIVVHHLSPWQFLTTSPTYV